MKKILLTALLSLFTLAVSAQGLDFNDFFNKYTGRDGYTTMDFSGALLKMLAGGESGNSFTGINSMKLVVAEGANNAFARDADATTSQAGYTRLFDVNSGGGEGFQVWHKEKGKGSSKSKDKTEYILLARDGKETTVIYIEGNIDLTNLSGLSKIGIGGK